MKECKKFDISAFFFYKPGIEETRTGKARQAEGNHCIASSKSWWGGHGKELQLHLCLHGLYLNASLALFPADLVSSENQQHAGFEEGQPVLHLASCLVPFPCFYGHAL